MSSKLRYIAVADAIRQEILDGIYLPGDRLPHQHDLAKLHNVAFNTLKQALDLLSREGYIVRKVAQGTFAALPEPQIPTALVVDDDREIRVLLSRVLEDYQWKATAVDSGETALTTLEDRSFDLIFLDLHLEGKPSLKGLKELRSYAPLLPVVVMVRSDLEKYAKKSFDLGAQECLTIHQLWTLPLFPLVDSAIHRQAYLNKMLEPV